MAHNNANYQQQVDHHDEVDYHDAKFDNMNDGSAKAYTSLDSRDVSREQRLNTIQKRSVY